MTLALLVALLGGVGAVMRYLLDHLISSSFGRHLPWGTMIVNVLGALAAGVVVGLSINDALSSRGVALVLTGLLGGFTTASTFSFEVAELLRERRFVAGGSVAVGTMAAALLGVIIGLLLA